MESEYVILVRRLMEQGWDEQSAQDRAADIVQRYVEKPALTCGGVVVNYIITEDGSMCFR